MTGQPVKRYEDVPAIQLCSRAALDEFLSRYWPELLRQINDFSRTDAARVEAERKVNAAIYERDVLLSRISALESRPEVIAQLEDEKRVLAERVAELEQYRAWAEPQIVTHGADVQRIAALESDLSAVTASSVEHAKTIDGLRAELARAREALRNLANKASGLRACEGELRATCGNTNFSLLMDAVAAADAALSSSQARESERQEGVFGRDDQPAVMVYTAKLLKDGTHHEFDLGWRQVVLFGDHQRALDKQKAALSVSGAEKAEWVPWKPGDALPEGALFTTTVHGFGYRAAFVSMTTPKGFEESGVLAYWSEPLPPPYQAIKDNEQKLFSQAKENDNG